MQLLKRWQEKSVRDALKTRRVVILSGARQIGKTTLARQVSQEATYRTLDDHQLLQYAKEDPISFLKHDKSLMIIDEVQKAPELLPAIKMVVDTDTRYGQFLLTGSANVFTLPTVTESLAGRVHQVRLCPLTHGELRGKEPSFLSRLLRFDWPNDMPALTRKDLLAMAFTGGFPEAVHMPIKQRKSWYTDYLESIIVYDLKDFAKVKKVAILRQLVAALAAWSGKWLDFSELAKGFGVSIETIQNYIELLKMLYLVDEVPSWTRTDYERVKKKGKFFMTDTGLMTALLDWDLDKTEINSDHVGKLIETLVFNELSAQKYVYHNALQLYHYRDRAQHEIDFLIESSGALFGIEVKAGSHVGTDDAQHLCWFEKNLSTPQPFYGVILYNGTISRRLTENIVAVPLSVLWE